MIVVDLWVWSVGLVFEFGTLGVRGPPAWGWGLDYWEVVNMETVTDPRTGADRWSIEVTWEALRVAVEDAEAVTRGGSSVDFRLGVLRDRWGVVSTSRAEALREMLALIGLLTLALEEMGPEYGVAGASLLVPAGGWS